MTKKTYFKFVYECTSTKDNIMLTYEIGHEQKVIDFLISLTNNDLYSACLIDLNMKAETNPELEDSVEKILNGIKGKLIETLDTPVLKPSQVFRGRN